MPTQLPKLAFVIIWLGAITFTMTLWTCTNNFTERYHKAMDCEKNKTVQKPLVITMQTIHNEQRIDQLIMEHSTILEKPLPEFDPTQYLE